MATSLSVAFSLNVRATNTSTLDLGTVVDTVNKTYSDTLANGTSTDQADISWSDTRTLAATSEDLDMLASLTNGFGTSLSFVKLRSITIKNKNTSSGHTLTIGAATANGVNSLFANTSDAIIIKPNGLLHLEAPTDGYGCTAGADLLKIDAGANTVVFDIILVGCSA